MRTPLLSHLSELSQMSYCLKRHKVPRGQCVLEKIKFNHVLASQRKTRVVSLLMKPPKAFYKIISLLACVLRVSN